jgi:hypothetical protein
MTTDPKDIYVEDLQRRLQDTRTALEVERARAEAAELEVERLALLLCPPLPEGWRRSQTLEDGEAHAIVRGGTRSVISAAGDVESFCDGWPGGTGREEASYLLGLLLRPQLEAGKDPTR